MFRNFAIVSYVICVTLSGVSLASATHYVITDIGTLSGDTSSGAYGVNDSGQVAGVTSYYNSGSDFASHAVLYSGGTLTDLGALVNNTTRYAGAYGINNSGAVVFSVRGAGKRAYIYNGVGNIITIANQGGDVNGQVNQALAINNSGQATGWYMPVSGQASFYLYSGGTNGTTSNVQASIPNNPFYNTTGYSINNLGAVAGNGFLYAGSPPMPYYYPFVWSPTAGIQQIGTQPGTADAVNDSGVVVGTTAVTSGSRQPASAFVAVPVAGSYLLTTTLPSLGDGSTDGAYGISNTGLVVGESAGKATVDVQSGATWTVTDSNSLISPTSGWTLQAAEAISNNGNYIAGNGTIGGQTHGFLLTAALPGDATLDGTVNIDDLSKVLSNYDKTGVQWADGDFDGNGAVNIDDLSKILSNYDKSVGAAAAGIKAVPEPATLVLSAVGLAGWLAFAGGNERKT